VSLGARLQELDTRLVPRAAYGLAVLRDEAGARRGDAGQVLLAGLSRHRVGLLLAGLVLVSCAGLALGRPGAAPLPDTLVPVGSPTVLGPPVGTDIGAYVAQSGAHAALAARTAPAAVHTGLVSFRRYLTPEQVSHELGRLTVRKVVLRARLPQAAVLPVAVTDVLSDTRAAYAGLAASRAQDQREFTDLAASIRPRTPAERRFQASYTAAAGHAGAESAAYRGDCACVIAALVRGTARDLAALRAAGAVRVVELGGTRDQAAVQIRPLLPEQQGVVSAATRDGA
jgi:hypothetical protein